MAMRRTESHQRAAQGVHLTVVIIFGLLALLSVAGGIVAIVWNALSETRFALFGANFTTGHVGVAFVGIGLLTCLFTVRAVMKNLVALAALPPDDLARSPQDQKAKKPAAADKTRQRKKKT